MQVTTKRCRKCGTTNADGYVNHATRYNKRDGAVRRYYMCRACNNARTKNYYHRNKERCRAIIYRSIAKHWEKQHARLQLNRAVQTGKIDKPKACSHCGDTKRRIEGHHHDHSKPFDVVWLCTPCHADVERTA